MAKKYKYGFNLPVTKKRIEMTNDELKADKLFRMRTKKRKAKARIKYKNTNSTQSLKMYDKEQARLKKLIDAGDFSQLIGYDPLAELNKEQNRINHLMNGYGHNYGYDLLSGIAKENSLTYYKELIKKPHDLYLDQNLTQHLAEQSKISLAQHLAEQANSRTNLSLEKNHNLGYEFNTSNNNLLTETVKQTLSDLTAANQRLGCISPLDT